MQLKRLSFLLLFIMNTIRPSIWGVVRIVVLGRPLLKKSKLQRLRMRVFR